MPTHTGDHRFVASTYGLDLYRLYVDQKIVLDRSHERQPVLAKTLRLEAGHAVPITLEYSHRDHHAQIGFGVRRADSWTQTLQRSQRVLIWCWWLPASIH